MNKGWLHVSDHEDHLDILKRAGVVVSTEMIIGTDGDTEESIAETRRFIDRNRIPIPRVYILTPIPGTQLYRDMKAGGRLLTEDWKQFDGSRAVHRPRRIDPDRLNELYWWLNREIFSWRSIGRRVVGNLHLWRNPKMLVFALAINLHYRRYVRRKVTPNIF